MSDLTSTISTVRSTVESTAKSVVDKASALVTSVLAKLPFGDAEAPADVPAPAKPTKATKKSA